MEETGQIEGKNKMMEININMLIIIFKKQIWCYKDSLGQRKV